MNIKRVGNQRIGLALLIISTVMSLLFANRLATTAASLTDPETATGNSFEAWSTSLWTQTTQADFEAGVPNQVDTSSAPGDVKLAVRSDWYNADWQYRRAITIDHTKVQDVANPSTTYANFPVLVYATGLSNINANGADIRFTSSDGITELPREIESYSSGTLYAWVKVTLTKDAGDSSNDVIYAYYGNAAATEPDPGSTYGSQNVWDSNFKMVQHMKDDPDTSHIADSTSNDNDGTKIGANEPNEVSENISKAQDFDGGNDYINCGNDASLEVDYITVEGWAQFDVNTGKRVIASIDDGTNRRWALYLLDSPYCLRFFVFVNNSWKSPDYLWQPTPGTWYFIVGVKSPTYVRTYINGVEVGTPQNHPGVIDKDPMNLRIGVGNYPGYFDGTMDEVRISNIDRSAEWIFTEHNNQSNPSAFYTVSAEEGKYVTSGTVASQVLDAGIPGAVWDGLFWDETLESNTDITFEVRASDTLFNAGDANPPWNDVGGTSPVVSGLPSGRYIQWRAVLATSDEFNTPTLSEVRLYYF